MGALFHEAYGLPADPERTAWYRALWNLDDDEIVDAAADRTRSRRPWPP